MRARKGLRVLLLASGCDETDVGEIWSSFQWVRGVAERHEVTLLTLQKRHGLSVVAQLPNVRVVEWLDWPMVGRMRQANNAIKPGYIGFYYGARRWVQKALRCGESFDVAHQVSPLALRYPCPVVGLGIPVICGPLGGSLTTPKAFSHEFDTEPWYIKLRILDRWRLRYDPWLRRSYQEAEVVIGVAPYVRDLLAGIRIKRFEVMSETGVVSLPPLSSRPRCRAGELRLLFVGRVVRSKGVRDAIRAMARLKDLPNVTLDIVGDGSDLVPCKLEASRLGVGEKVRFHGRQPRSACDLFYSQAHVFLFPSMREPSGNVVFESLSHGLPVIAAARGGPGFVINGTCGLLVPLTDPQDYANRLAMAARQLARDPELVGQLGVGARRRISEVGLWDRKIVSLLRLYGDVVRSASARRGGNATDSAHTPNRLMLRQT